METFKLYIKWATMYTACCKQEASLYELGVILMKEKVYRQKKKKITAAYVINLVVLVVSEKIMLTVNSNENQ